MTCPAYGFTATLPPDQAMVISAAIDVVRDEPERRRQLWDNQRYFVQLMRELDYKLVSTQTPIVPIWLGDEARAEHLARAVREEGIHVDAVTFPAVPMNSARIRIQLNAAHRRADIDHLVEVLKRHQRLAEPARKSMPVSDPVIAARVPAAPYAASPARRESIPPSARPPPELVKTGTGDKQTKAIRSSALDLRKIERKIARPPKRAKTDFDTVDAF
jgi:hypothetical protein